MVTFLVVAIALVVVFLTVAALSDYRDRRAGNDPKVRTEDVTRHRRELREVLYRSRARRLGWHDHDEDKPKHPW